MGEEVVGCAVLPNANIPAASAGEVRVTCGLLSHRASSAPKAGGQAAVSFAGEPSEGSRRKDESTTTTCTSLPNITNSYDFTSLLREFDRQPLRN